MNMKNFLEYQKSNFGFGAIGREMQQPLHNMGCITQAVFVMPNFSNDVTGTLSIQDEEGIELYSSGPWKKSKAYALPNIHVDVAAGFTIKCRLSGDPGGVGDTVKVKLFIDCC
jgi:hypothetical protein